MAENENIFSRALIITLNTKENLRKQLSQFCMYHLDQKSIVFKNGPPPCFWGPRAQSGIYVITLDQRRMLILYIWVKGRFVEGSILQVKPACVDYLDLSEQPQLKTPGHIWHLCAGAHPTLTSTPRLTAFAPKTYTLQLRTTLQMISVDS